MTAAGHRRGERRRPGRERLFAALLCAMLFPCSARAELTLSGGVELFYWTQSSTPEVREDGPLYALGVGYTQSGDDGLLVAYRGKAWGGSVDYEGAYLGGAPAKGTTGYAGLSNELQVRWRTPGKVGGNIDGVLGAGLDVWRRRLTSVQREDYGIGYLRMGVESGTDESSRWTVSLGFKYPVWTYENAHFDRMGYDSNPILHPGKEISPFGSLGYRFTPNLQVVGYYEGFRFGRSEPVQARNLATGVANTFVQPDTTLSIFGIRAEYLLR